jgi:hypothetical protein
MKNLLVIPESLGMAFCTNSRLVVRTPFSVTNDIPPRGESKLIVCKCKRRNKITIFGLERKSFWLVVRGSYFFVFPVPLDDGVLCLYSHFIKEIKFMTQLQSACGWWIKKGLKLGRGAEKQQTFMINSLLYCATKSWPAVAQVHSEQYK